MDYSRLFARLIDEFLGGEIMARQFVDEFFPIWYAADELHVVDELHVPYGSSPKGQLAQFAYLIFDSCDLYTDRDPDLQRPYHLNELSFREEFCEKHELIFGRQD